MRCTPHIPSVLGYTFSANERPADMADPLKHTKAMIVVLAMPDCPACIEYKPRFEKMVDHFVAHGVPFAYYEPGQAIAKGMIPVLIVDATSTDPNVQQFCDAHNVDAMPTTILLTRSIAPQRIQGSISDDEIYQLLSAAQIANR